MKHALGLAWSVLGAGLLLVPPLTAGPAAPVAWLVTLLAGAGFSVGLGLLARRLPGAPGSIFDVVGVRFGGRARRVVLGGYVLGFTCGQSALALAAGRLLGYGLGLPRLAGWFAAAVLIAATAAGAAGLTLDDRARRVRLAATWVLAVACCALPQVFSGADLLPRGGNFGLAAFLVLFAGVGWETSAGLPRGRPVVRTVAGAAVVVLAASLVPVLVLAARMSAPSVAPPVPRLLAVLAAVVFALYCLTNIAAAGRFVALLGGSGGPAGRCGVGLAGLVVVVLALAAGWPVAGVLLVPCAVTCGAYCLVLAGAVGGPPRNSGATPRK